MLYFLYETQKRALQPFANSLQATSIWMEKLEGFTSNPLPKYIKASSELVHQFVRTYPKPNFNIPAVTLTNGQSVRVSEEIVAVKPFCELRHFVKDSVKQGEQPAMLIIAPLSGHYATLLRDTVKSSLKDFDVYITDWTNAAKVPVEKGDFGFGDYMDYCEEFMVMLKQKHGVLHTMSVCQPTVPVIAVIAHMEKHNPTMAPDSAVLMGGPIDTRQSPTAVNEYALKNDINWFKTYVLDVVPYYEPGAGRIVYPGFLQYTGFVAMNVKKHRQANIDFFNHMILGSDLDAKKHKNFYEEYNAVLDLDAKFYIETLENVFMDQKIAKGTLEYKGDIVKLENIKNTKVLAIEGELDDISGAGQTNVVCDLTTNLAKDKKLAVVAKEVGHYGLFSGSRWRNKIYPSIHQYLVENKNTFA